MKNLGKTIIGGIVVLGIATTVYSFTTSNKDNEPIQKKYEVFRMLNGEITLFDTIINSNSTYTAQNYLNDLGLNDDENISIIDLTQSGMSDMTMASDSDEAVKTIFIKSGNSEADIDEILKDLPTDSTANKITVTKSITQTNGEEPIENINVNIEGDATGIDIDSLINAVTKSSTTTSENGVCTQTMVFSSDSEMKDIDFKTININDADFHKIISNENGDVEVAMFTDGEDVENLTILMVTNPNGEAVNKSQILKDNHIDFPAIKVFPNPATQKVEISVSIIDNQSTKLSITNLNGKVVFSNDLGQENGTFTESINLKKWATGVYLVNVIQNNSKRTEKLIVK